MGSSTWRKAYGALNDSTKVGLTNLTASTRSALPILPPTPPLASPPDLHFSRLSPHIDTRNFGSLRTDCSSDYPARNFRSLQDLDIAIVKATNHVECPPKERHFRRIMFSTSVNRPRADVAYSICVDKIIDLATLTGACVVALGPSIAGIFTPSDELAEEVTLHLSYPGRSSGDCLWRKATWSG
ncbi:hypothetical protein ZWY2020_030505 [Hordeum vulgare]|nr:hypothetical protein ZWY2020_030505 [Hordeum vulgare]